MIKSEEIPILAIKDEINKIVSEIPKDVLDFDIREYAQTGKAVRTRFAFLFGRALNISESRIFDIALCCEMVHNASLLHDDCIDEALKRRGKPSLNSVLGINKAILLGDLMMGLAFDRANRLSGEISSQLVMTVQRMSEGALIEENSKNKIIDRPKYDRIVSLKTSALFRWITLSCAFFSKMSFFEDSALIAEKFGFAFQVVDDIIDIENCEDSGKDCLKDIMEGKITFPLILALNDKDFKDKNTPLIEKLLSLKVKDFSLAQEIIENLKKTSVLKDSRFKAREEIESLRPYLLTMPNKQAGSSLYSYMISAVSRKV